METIPDLNPKVQIQHGDFVTVSSDLFNDIIATLRLQGKLINKLIEDNKKLNGYVQNIAEALKIYTKEE